MSSPPAAVAHHRAKRANAVLRGDTAAAEAALRDLEAAKISANLAENIAASAGVITYEEAEPLARALLLGARRPDDREAA